MVPPTVEVITALDAVLSLVLAGAIADLAVTTLATFQAVTLILVLAVALMVFLAQALAFFLTLTAALVAALVAVAALGLAIVLALALMAVPAEGQRRALYTRTGSGNDSSAEVVFTQSTRGETR